MSDWDLSPVTDKQNVILGLIIHDSLKRCVQYLVEETFKLNFADFSYLFLLTFFDQLISVKFMSLPRRL